jgi:integrase
MKQKAANGQGSIFKGKTKSGRDVWFVEASVGYDKNGQRVRTRRTCHSKTEALQLLNTLTAQRQQGLLNVITADTVRTFGEKWIESKEGRIRQTTGSDYLSRLYTYIAPYLGNIKIIDLKPHHIQAWMVRLRNQGMSVRTINGARQVVLAICKHAMRQGLIHMNPVALVDPYSRSQNHPTQVREPWSLEEVSEVLDACWGEDKLECFLFLMLHTGMRPGEALAIRWEDIDLEKLEVNITGTLKEHRVLSPDGKGVVELIRNEPKTKSSQRTLPISPALLDVLERQEMRQSVFEGGKPEYLIATSKGTPTSLSNLRKSYAKFLVRKNIRYIRLHDIRHTVANISLNNAKTSIEQTSQALGHTRIDTTKQIYAGNIPRYNKEFIHDLGAVLPASRVLKHNPRTLEGIGNE